MKVTVTTDEGTVFEIADFEAVYSPSDTIPILFGITSEGTRVELQQIDVIEN